MGLLFFYNISHGQTNHLKVLSYNAFYGFEQDKDKFNAFNRLLEDLDPDIILFQEMNGFDQNKLSQFANGYGHKYSVIMNKEFGVPNTHPLAISSKYPILNVQRVLDDMWHGYIYATINDVHIFNLHLAPFTVLDRKKDIEKVIAQAKLLDVDKGIIIAGDFNALSPMDTHAYGEELLESMRSIEGRYETKSGTEILRFREIHRNNLIDDQIDYSVIGHVLDAGYSDVIKKIHPDFINSVPTEGHRKRNSKLRRIDYIFVNPVLIDNVIRAEIVKNELTDHLSDHYPVFITFK
ncbi:endonuclease/exonuclease/phosphatase family protein [Indibacter alkaliphilus]|nr:endonuclease/exonuclease/phosphatase family protein [Indibacter alkaliphilus]